MGITLTGKRVQNTYDSLLKLSSNDNLTSTPQLVGDGLGNDSPIYLSTNRVGIGVSPTVQFETSGDAKIGGSLTVTSNLYVEGNLTYVDSTVVEIGDNMIELAKDNVANIQDIGWYGTIVQGGTKYAGMYYDASTGVSIPEFHIGIGTVEPGATATWSTKAKLVIGQLDSTGATINGNLSVTGTIADSDGDVGTSGQVLSSTGSGTNWIDSGSAETAERIEIQVKNVSGGTLAKGTVVHVAPTVSPPSGNVVEVIAADYDDAARMPAIGILKVELTDDNEGAAVMMGALSGIDTSSFSAGDELYVGNLGTLTNTKPTATTQLIQKIAVVVKSHASNGLIKVFGAGRANDVPNKIDRDVQWTGGDLYFDEDIQARFLYSSNKSDVGLRIQHNGSHSFIDGEYGNLYIRAEADDGDIVFQADDGSGNNTTYFELNGGVSYSIASKRIRFNDSVDATFGTGNDLKIYHTADTASYVQNTKAIPLIIDQDGAEDLEIKSNRSVDIFIDKNNDDTTTSFNILSNTNTYATANVVFEVTQTGNVNIDGNVTINNDSTLIIPSHSGFEIDITGTNAGNIRANAQLYLLSQTSSLHLGSNGVNSRMTIDTSGNTTFSGDVTIGTNDFTAGTATIGGILLQDSSDRSGLLEINRKDTSTWSGIQIKHSTALWSFMGGTNDVGLYDDINGKWAFLYNINSSLELRHNGTTKITTTSAGADINGDLTVEGGDIILEGTGRIQGIDTITDGTDAVNKNYVDDNFVDGSGTANDVVMWSDSDTLTDAPIAISGNNATFAGDISAVGGSFTNPVTIFDTTTTENPRLSLGRQAAESLQFSVYDTEATITHKQDSDTNAIHYLDFIIDSNSTGEKVFRFKEAGNTTGTYLTLNSTSATFAGDVTLDNKLNFTNTSYQISGGATVGDLRFVAPRFRFYEDSISGTAKLEIDGGNATFAGDVTISKSVGDAVLTIEADTDNNNENDNPRIELKQDGGLVYSYYGLNGNLNDTFTGAETNYTYLRASTGFQLVTNASTTALTIDTSQNATFAGIGEFAGAIRITETGTSQNILIGNQDSGGVNKPAMINGVNGHIRIGYGSSWTGEGGTFTSQMTFNANGVEVYGINDSQTNAFKVQRGSDNAEAFRVENSGEVVVSNNYLYASHSGTSFYAQGQAVFRNGILNDGGALKVLDDLEVTGDVFPITDSAYDLGSTSLRWANVWADNINGGSPVNGSGAAGRVAFWTDGDTLSSDSVFYYDNTNNRLGINVASPDHKLQVSSGNGDTTRTVSISHTRNDADTATQALHIDANFSGTKTAATDTVQSGIFIDLDSTADGSSADEVRSYGVYVDARITGFNDILRGGYFYVESNNITEKTSEIVGVYGNATHDSSSTNGGVSNMYGVRGVCAIQDYGDVDNSYAVHGLVQISNNRNANVDATRALFGEIQIDEQTALSYGTMIGCQIVIDNNEGSVPTLGSQYLFKGDYQGTQGAGSYGIYVEGSRHYLSNNLGIGNTDPQAYLHIGDSTPVGAEALIARGNTDNTYVVSIEQDHATGWGMIIDTDATDADSPALKITNPSGTLMEVASNGDVEINGDVTINGIDNATAADADRVLVTSNETGEIQYRTTAQLADDMNVPTGIGGAGLIPIYETSSTFTTGSLYWDIANGRMGINEIAPAERLHVGGNAKIEGNVDLRTANEVTSTNQIYFNAYNGNVAATSNDLGPGITWKSNYTGYTKRSAGILQVGEGNYFRSGLAFFTNEQDNATTDWIERMRISMDGNVGIGEDEPSYKLHVEGNSYINATSNSANLTLGRYSGQPTIKAGTDDGGYLIMDSTGGRNALNWYSGDHVVLVNGGGYVGIGLGTPSEKLHILQNTADNLVSLLEQDNASYQAWYEAKSQNSGFSRHGISDNADAYAFTNFSVGYYKWMHNAGGDLMKLDSNGRLGIGTTAATEKLQVNGNIRVAGVGNAISFDTTGANSSNYIKTINDYETLIANNRGAAGFAVVGNSSIRLGFGGNFTASQTNLYIQASNDFVGINRQPDATLHVAGYIMADTDNSARDAHVERNITIPYQGASGYYDFDPVALFGASAAGGYVLVEVHGWQTRFNAGYIHWRNNGSSNTAAIGTGGVTFRQTAWSGSASGAGISVSTVSSSANVIRITLSGWHSNAHGWQAYIRYPR
jgi:hypothetical protein